MKLPKTIIGIDPGASGGIAIHSKGFAKAYKMPPTIKTLNEFFIEAKETYEDILVLKEVVSAWAGSEDDAGGKKFNINKMLKQQTTIEVLLEINGFRYVDIYPISWQTRLGLKPKGDKRTKTQKKASYKEFAQNCFPEVKVTLATSDALCLVQLAFVLFDRDPKWISSRIQNVQENKLF